MFSKSTYSSLLLISITTGVHALNYDHYHGHEAHTHLDATFNDEDFERMSKEREDAAVKIASDIKNILYQAFICTQDFRTVSTQIFSNPQKYSVPIIRAKWDEALANLKDGKKCSACGRTKTEMEEQGTNFEEHVRSVGGVIQRAEAKPEDFARVNKLFSERMKTAQDLLDKMNKSKNERERLIWSTFNIRDSQLYPAYRNSINYQLQSYASDREEIVEPLKNQAEMLHVLDELLELMPPTHPEFLNYYRQRIDLAKDMRTSVDDLNVLRKRKMNSAQRKQAKFVELNRSIQESARRLGEDSDLGTSGVWVANTYVYPDGTALGLYRFTLAPEKLGFFVSENTAELVQRVLSEQQN